MRISIAQTSLVSIKIICVMSRIGSMRNICIRGRLAKCKSERLIYKENKYYSAPKQWQLLRSEAGSVFSRIRLEIWAEIFTCIWFLSECFWADDSALMMITKHLLRSS